MTGAQWRKLALSMPEAAEKAHFGKPDFRVANKIFAGLSADEKRGSLKLTPEIQAAALGASPKVFTPCEGAWGTKGWTYVQIAAAEAGMIAELMRESWRLVAPKKLVEAETKTAAGKTTAAKRKTAAAKKAAGKTAVAKRR